MSPSARVSKRGSRLWPKGVGACLELRDENWEPTDLNIVHCGVCVERDDKAGCRISAILASWCISIMPGIISLAK